MQTIKCHIKIYSIVSQMKHEDKHYVPIMHSFYALHANNIKSTMP